MIERADGVCVENGDDRRGGRETIQRIQAGVELHDVRNSSIGERGDVGDRQAHPAATVGKHGGADGVVGEGDDISRRIKGNFVNLDLVALQRDLELVPWVRSVSIRRLWPDRLVLELEERTALARWNGRALVDSAGEIFAGKYAGSLTSFVGPPGSARQMSEQYAEFKEVLHSAGLAPLELLLSQRRSWTLRLNNGLTLQLGRDEPARRLARFVSAYAVLGEYGAPGANVDLRYNNGFALRMAERPGAASSQK